MAFALPFCLASCVSGYEIVTADVPPAGWSKPVTLRYANTDTLTPKDLSLAFRHSVEVSPLEGVYVVDAVSPSIIEVWRDTLHVAFRIPVSGNNLHETTLSLRSDAVFLEQGDYFFTVTPLPPQEVRGVWSVAIEFH